MKEAVINGIFPTPIYMSKLDRALTPLELKFVDKNKKDFYKNEGNITSNNNYILNEKPFLNLKKELDLRIKDYFKKVISSTDAVTPYITQSWLNVSEPGGGHHPHAHPNSFISGTFYIQALEEENMNFRQLCDQYFAEYCKAMDMYKKEAIKSQALAEAIQMIKK
jgi:uncharacterized protein (TIGR02466 family)